MRGYLDFTKTRGKYSFVASIEKVDLNRPQNRGDFGKQVSNSTLNNYLITIKVFFNFCFDNKNTQINPISHIRQFKVARRPKEDISDLDFEKLIKAIDTTTSHST